MKNKSIFWIIVVLVLLLGAAFLLYQNLAPSVEMDSLTTEESANVKQPEAKDFTVFSPDGKEVKLSDFRGKPVVLNFWSSRCGPCQKEMPDFQAAYDRLGDAVEFVMVNATDGYWDSPETANAFIAENGYTFPYYLDTEFEAANAYSVRSLPATFFITAEGTLAAKATGMLTPEKLQKGIDFIYTAP